MRGAAAAVLIGALGWPDAAARAEAALRAGTAKADAADYQAGPVHDPAYVKALALDDGSTRAVLITVDAVALAEIGRIDGGYLGRVRAALQQDPGIPPENVLINASHCHHVVRKDIDALTIAAVREAWRKLTPVRAGAGRGREDRIMENRRLRLKSGAETDVRRAYAMPRDEDVTGTGPVDPEIGLLRLDRAADGVPLAAIYNFAAHPIMGVPGGGNTADYPAFASRVIEENLAGSGSEAMAFFVQGCAGDVNPARYKDVHQPHDAEPLGNLLGLSALRGLRTIRTSPAAALRVINEKLEVPRAADYDARIAAMRARREELVRSLKGTSLNFKTFAALLVQYKLFDLFPSYYSHRYLEEKERGLRQLANVDAENRAEMARYLDNIETMEELTRLNTNLELLEKHRADPRAGDRVLTVEVGGLRIGDFRLVTFPGELTAEIGLRIKKRAPLAFVAGYTNGYIYYTPTAGQRRNPGYAQEDCDSWVAPEWQGLFEERAVSVLSKLSSGN